MEYPVDYINKIINGDIVLDNCAGSCTTAIAADNTSRRWICIEKEHKYCEIGIKRVEANQSIHKQGVLKI